MNEFFFKIKTLWLNNQDEEVYSIIEKQLDLEHQADPIIWNRLARILLLPPFVDYDKAFECLKKTFSLDSNNIIAWILFSFIHEYYLGGIDDKTLDKILALTKTTPSSEDKSMLEYISSWSYSRGQKNDFLNEEKLLKESVLSYKYHVWNHAYLARLYISYNKHIQAIPFLEQALNNVKKIYPENLEAYDPTDINEFLNERIKGIYMTESTYTKLQQDLYKCKLID